jgi:hypothetical protein
MGSELLHKYKTRVLLIKLLIEKSLYQGTFSRGLYGKFQAKRLYVKVISLNVNENT